MTVAIYEKQVSWKGMTEEINYVSRVYDRC
jgi:hypothetical protein